MDQFGVQINLEAVAEARQAWAKARIQHESDVQYVMTRLLHEAAANYMSVEQVAKASGLTPSRVRSLMRDAGLDPRRGKKLLAKTAAEALQENAALLGIEPHEMDLMSPLAYLPMGSEMRERILETPRQAGKTARGEAYSDLREKMIDALEAEWLAGSEAKTVDSPRGHCARLADAVLAVLA